MSPSNKTKQSKTKAAKYPQPLANTSALERNNHTVSPSNDNPSSTSLMRITFRQYLELAKLCDIKFSTDAASSTPDGENLKHLWARAFQEGFRVGHQLHEKTAEKIKEAHNKGYEEGYSEGHRDEEINRRCEGHGEFCAPLQVRQDSGTQTEPPSLVDASASTDDSLPLPPVIPTAPVLKPPPKTEPRPPPLPSMQPLKPKPYKRQDLASEPHPQPSPAHFDWANDAASLPILPRNPPPRDLSVLRSSSQQPFSSLQRRNKKSKKHFSQPFRCHHSSSVPHQKNFQARYLPFRSSSAPFVPAPRSRSPSTLNWEDDPQLSDLSRALRALGWIRPPAARAPPW